MEYAANAINQNYGTSTSSGQIGMQTAAPTPRTISSAASRIDALNERLSKAVEGLSMVSSQLGALTSVNGIEKNGQSEPSGAVHRLNDSADNAHNRIGEIESLIAGISRALG